MRRQRARSTDPTLWLTTRDGTADNLSSEDPDFSRAVSRRFSRSDYPERSRGYPNV